eukprot:3466164-Prymnesium_polylepis.1
MMTEHTSEVSAAAVPVRRTGIQIRAAVAQQEAAASAAAQQAEENAVPKAEPPVQKAAAVASKQPLKETNSAADVRQTGSLVSRFSKRASNAASQKRPSSLKMDKQ